MSYEIPGFSIGIFPANIDMSVEATWQFRFVDVVVASATTGYGNGGAALGAPSGVGVPGLGIVQNNPMVGEAGLVMTDGVSKAVAGGTIALDALLMIKDASGSLITATSTNYAVAKALESAVSGDIFAVLVKNYGKV